MGFVSVDVETANPDLSSICQIGVVRFEDGEIADRWKINIDPESYFDPINTSVHGMTAADVAGAPTFPDVAAKLHEFFGSSIVCHHTAFDRTALHAVHALYEVVIPEIQWLDTARVVRRTWLDRSRSGYGLKAVAEMLGINFLHHDAEEDARVAGEILLHAISKSSISLEEWLTRSRRPITLSGGEDSKRSGNPEGPLFGEIAVFTGALSMPRREAADLAAEAGCDVKSGVSKSTTLLVVGDQDVARLAGHSKSSKHRKAEALIEKGQAIRILRESDFKTLLETARL